MSKTEYAWVIQRDDGMFWCGYDAFIGQHIFSKRIFDGLNTQHPTYKNIREEIKNNYLYLQNCRPVKVKISIVGEDDEPNEIN